MALVCLIVSDIRSDWELKKANLHCPIDDVCWLAQAVRIAASRKHSWSFSKHGAHTFPTFSDQFGVPLDASSHFKQNHANLLSVEAILQQ